MSITFCPSVSFRVQTLHRLSPSQLAFSSSAARPNLLNPSRREDLRAHMQQAHDISKWIAGLYQPDGWDIRDETHYAIWPAASKRPSNGFIALVLCQGIPHHLITALGNMPLLQPASNVNASRYASIFERVQQQLGLEQLAGERPQVCAFRYGPTYLITRDHLGHPLPSIAPIDLPRVGSSDEYRLKRLDLLRQVSPEGRTRL